MSVAERETEEILAAYFDGALDDEGAERLEVLLAEDPEATRCFK